MNETALIVSVPACEPAVGRFRERYDASAAVGVPAHVTLLYPFLAPDEVTADDLAALTTLFASAVAFDVEFARCRRFGTRVLFLAPEPEEPFLDLMHRIFERWPECPPYHGTIPPADIVSHLTVSDSTEGDHLDRVELAVTASLPVRTRVTEAWLIENRSGLWTTREKFLLGG